MNLSRFFQRTRSGLTLLLFVLQAGFVNAESLWMMAANVEHHHLLENSSFVVQYQVTEHHQEGIHHCDVCHGHSAHFALTPAVHDPETPELLQQTRCLPELPYSSRSVHFIYRPPIFSVV